MNKFLILCTISIVFGVSLIVTGVPISTSNIVTNLNNNGSSAMVVPFAPNDDGSDSDENNSTESNGTHKELYVIKAVVYEIGVLTEVPDDENSTESDEYSHERVDLTFFDAHSNGTHLDLGNIPLPVQTNVTGQVLTGIAPIHIGSIQNATDLFHTLPLTGTIVNISHSDTSYINLSHAPSMGPNGTIINSADLAKLPGLNNNTKPILLHSNSPMTF